MLDLLQLGLKGTELATATPRTIRLKLLKIGTLVRVTVRKVWLILSQSYLFQPLFAAAHAHLCRAGPARPV